MVNGVTSPAAGELLPHAISYDCRHPAQMTAAEGVPGPRRRFPRVVSRHGRELHTALALLGTCWFRNSVDISAIMDIGNDQQVSVVGCERASGLGGVFFPHRSTMAVRHPRKSRSDRTLVTLTRRLRTQQFERCHQQPALLMRLWTSLSLCHILGGEQSQDMRAATAAHRGDQMANATDKEGTAREENTEVLVPVLIEGQKVYLSVRDLRTPQHAPGAESEIAAHRPTLDEALDGLMGLVRVMGARLRQSDASKVTMEFSCEFALESGTFVAVIGKASTKSAFGVALEWENHPS